MSMPTTTGLSMRATLPLLLLLTAAPLDAQLGGSRYSCSMTAGTRISIHEDNERSRMLIVDRDHCLDVRSQGRVTFDDDDSDVVGVTSGGYLEVVEVRRGVTRRAMYEERGGSLTRRYWEDGAERTAADLASWLRTVLPSIARESSIGAQARAERILRQRGPAGVTAEIAEIRSESVKEIYLNTLLADSRTGVAEHRAIARRLSSMFSSDTKRANLSMKLLEQSGGDAAVTESLLQGSRSISSDHQRALLLQAVIGRGALGRTELTSVLRSTRDISSDREKANVLVAVAAKHRPMNDEELRKAFLDATKTISSSREYRRVMESVVR
jgi:hypothetical protein